MAAGLGFKSFATGEVLTAADTNGYLMQGILVFASAAARDAAITSPQEGQACYLKDTNQVLTYSGSTWVAVGGGSPLTTKGDLYTFSTVDARLPVGTNGQVLTADSTQSTGLKFATPAGGSGMTLLSTTTLSGSTVSLSSISNAFIDLQLIIVGATATANFTYDIRPNATTGNFRGLRINTGDLVHTNNATLAANVTNMVSNNTINSYCIKIYDYANNTRVKNVDLFGEYQNSVGDGIPSQARGIFNYTTTISSIDIVCSSTFNGGTALLYGVK